MNRIYKLIWSKVKNCYVVTSELAKSHTKGCSGKRVGRLLVVGAIVAGLVLPMGEAGAWNGIYTMGYQAYGGENAIGFYNNYNYNNFISTLYFTFSIIQASNEKKNHYST